MLFSPTLALQATEAATGAALEAPSTVSVMLLAIVQGLTEFLPVSSSGHLAIGREVLGLQEGGLALDVALHVGTLLAIVVAFREDVLRLFTDLAKGRLGLWVWLIVATVPVGIVGILGKDTVEAAAGTVRAAGVGLFVTATALMIGERFRVRRTGVAANADVVPDAGTGGAPVPPLSLALVMGCAQAVAIWPGISRSGSTISAAFVRGQTAAEAARLSFLMSLPAISGAAIVELPGALEVGFGGIAPSTVLLAALLAAAVGFGALKTLLLVLRKGSFPYFAGYCAIMGCVALWLGR